MLTPLYAGNIRHDYHGDGIHLALDRLATTSHGLEAWVELRWTGNVPSPALLHYGRYDLMGSRTAASIINAVPDEYRRLAEWEADIKTAIYNTIKLVNEGEPIHLLTPKPMDGGKWVVRPLVASTGATGIIGPGGSLKSFLALALACSVATGDPAWVGWKPQKVGPVLYLDWEADQETHQERLYAFGGKPEDLYYRREKGRPLHRSVEGLVKQIAVDGIVLAVIDSVMLARGSGGEGSYENSTVLFYAALAELGIPTLLVDHKSKDDMKNGRKGAYGSIVNDNSRRLSWEVTGVLGDGNTRIIRLEQGKSNNVGRLEPVAMRIELQSNEKDGLRSAQVRRVDITETSGINVVTLATRIHEILVQAPEPMTVAELAEKLDSTPSAVRGTLNRMEGEVRNVGNTEKGLWELDYRVDSLPNPF